ncbi:MAG TPA: ADOP family duplicated permease [Vicinamibacterales bacterium]
MGTLLQELRVAARMLARRPGFALVVIITLALGIGAMTTCFAVLNAVAFRPLPFADPDRLVAVRTIDRRTSGGSPLSLDTFATLRQSDATFAGLAAYRTHAATVAGPGLARQVQVAHVAGDLFSLLGVPVQRGRALAMTDAGTRVAVVSDDLWAAEWGSSPDVVGTTFSLDGDTYAVAGVAARAFSFPQDSRVWIPFDRTSDGLRVDIVARLAPGATPARADAALTSAAPDAFAATVPLRRQMIGAKQRAMAVFVLAAAALVLLLACANLAGLLAAQIDARKYEMALRSAIGADRRQLVRQLMIESVLLAVAGGMTGLILAQWGVDLFAATVGKPDGAAWIAFAIDARVVIFALSSSLATALVFGLAPAFAGTRVDLRGVLQADAGAATPGPGPQRGRSLLVAAQLALSLALVVGAASIVTSALRFDDIDPGFDRNGILAVKVAFTGNAYAQPEQRFAFIDTATHRLRAVNGVTAVAAASHLPLIDRDLPYTSFAPENAGPTELPPSGSVRFVDAGYIAAMRIPIRRGRAFTPAEARHPRDRAVIINDRMARRYWPDRDPIGTRVHLTGNVASEGWYTVVGVVGEVSQRQLPAAPENQLYLPLALANQVSLMMRATSDAFPIAAQAREAVQGIDHSLAISTSTMTGAYEWYASDRRSQGLVVGTLGGIALLLAGLGVYSVMAIMVNGRSREIAIRMALGSSTGAVRRLVLARGLTVAVAGVGTGLLLATALTAFLSSIFLGVRAFDVRLLVAAVALLGGVTLLASWWPARRAMRVDPMVTLKR